MAGKSKYGWYYEEAKRRGMHQRFITRINKGWDIDRALNEPVIPRDSVKGKEFALYKGDNLLGMGTLEELAELGVTTYGHLKFMHTPSYVKLYNNAGKQTNRMYLVDLADEDESGDWGA